MPFEPILIASVIAVVFVAALVRATWGFGDSIVAIPLLTLLIGMQVAAPMLVLISIALSISLLRERPSLVDLGVTVRLLLGAVVGIPIGLYVLTELPEAWTRRGLGVLLVGFAIVSLIRARRLSRDTSLEPELELEPEPAVLAPAKAIPLDLGFGVLVGACIAAFDISGPVLLLHAAVRRWTPDQLRMNLQAVFLPLGVLTMTGHALSGLWTREVGLLAACGLPAVILAVVLGARLRTKLDGPRGAATLYVVIFALGILMLAA